MKRNNRYYGLLTLALTLVSCLILPTQAGESKARPKTVLDYRQELALSQADVDQITSVLKGLQADLQKLQAKHEAAQKELQKALAAEAEPEKIRGHLLEAATIKIDLQMADINAARRIRDVLGPERTRTWKQIQLSRRKSSKPS